MSPRIGDRIGDYEVTGLLGSGGMGAVYQVRHLISGRTEAMKVLLPDFESNSDLAERFIREIRLQASLSHPNIASLHTALRLNNQLLMIMEFVDGQTLAEILRREPLSQLQALQFAIQILSALEYAHTGNVIHRDVKPSNIMITADGAVKLMDFGIARNAQDFGRLTQAGAAIGSMYYMSPEQILGDDVDARSDLYSVGVTLFEALTGVRPFNGKTSQEVLDAHLRMAPPDPADIDPRVSRELSRIVLHVLEKDRANRYQTAGAFRQALTAVLQSLMSSRLLDTEPDLTSLRRPERIQPYSTPAPVAGVTSGPRAVPQTGSGSLRFDPISLERLRKELAQHIGPMAKLLVDRAAKRSRNWQELYGHLAPEIPSGKARERFRASCPRD